MKDLPLRIISAAVLIAGTVYVVGFAPSWLFVAVQCLMLAGMIWEVATMLEKKYYIGSKLAPVAGGLTWNLLHFYPKYEGPVLTGLLLGVLCFAMWQKREMPQRLECLLTVLFASAYPAILWRPLLGLRELQAGDLLIAHLIAINFSTDSGAYFAGKLFGRHQLSPQLSPKKTWEGLAGGAILAMIVSFPMTHAAVTAIDAHLSLPSAWISVTALLLGIVIALSGQASDLAESLLKRASGVKDSGAIIPGHGGLLDRCDSLLFNIPLVYYYWFYMGARTP
ncbi:MAG: phosphatidate cytidylyltransferase [Acidobacteria bacterium]|nr:phosphatidate cytidylyltransferase [Acidobacteriota bacterium]